MLHTSSVFRAHGNKRMEEGPVKSKETMLEADK